MCLANSKCNVLTTSVLFDNQFKTKAVHRKQLGYQLSSEYWMLVHTQEVTPPFAKFVVRSRSGACAAAWRPDWDGQSVLASTMCFPLHAHVCTTHSSNFIRTDDCVNQHMCSTHQLFAFSLLTSEIDSVTLGRYLQSHLLYLLLLKYWFKY